MTELSTINFTLSADQAWAQLIVLGLNNGINAQGNVHTEIQAHIVCDKIPKLH